LEGTPPGIILRGIGFREEFGKGEAGAVRSRVVGRRETPRSNGSRSQPRQGRPTIIPC